jgi:hypothetical protein
MMLPDKPEIDPASALDVEACFVPAGYHEHESAPNELANHL